MLEWTGERFLPWLDQSLIAYEHLHRYAYAATFAKGKRVLDLASGEGYGSRILAAAASSVVAVSSCNSMCVISVMMLQSIPYYGVFRQRRQG